jgi:hypothetical protein
MSRSQAQEDTVHKAARVSGERRSAAAKAPRESESSESRRPALIGIQRCGCVTYANALPDIPMDRFDREAQRRIIESGGQLLRTTVAKARANPNFLPSECPHDPKGWG